VYTYRAKLQRVVDGDTVEVSIDLGFYTWVEKTIRINGVDTWESRTLNLEEKEAGKKAKEFTKELLNRNGGEFTIISRELDKFGRVLADIYVDGEVKSVTELLIENGHGYAYSGGTKILFGS